MTQLIKKIVKNNYEVFISLLKPLQDYELLLVSPEFRTSLAIIILILNIYSYYHNRIRFTKYKDVLFYFMLVLFIIDILFLYLLDIIAPVVSLPKYWWIIVITIAAIVLFSLNNNFIEKDHTFNPPPLSLSRKYTRKTIIILLLLIYLFSFISEYYINQTYDTGIDFRDNKLLHYIFKSRIIGILIIIINIYLTFNFHACKYNLPDTWNL